MSESDAARAWSDHADSYDSLFAPLTSFVARGLFSAAAHQLPKGARLLDVACGTGALSLPALDWARRMDGHVVATDFSSEMVRRTELALGRTGAPAGTFRTAVENGEKLTFEEGAFDAVFSCFGIFLFSDRISGFREAARVLKPGGLFGTTVWQGPATNAMLRAQMKPVMEALPARLRPDPSTPPARSWMEIADANALRAEVEGLGVFDQVSIAPFQATFVIGERERAWRAMQNNPVLGALLRACSTEELSVIRDHLFDHFTELSGSKDAPVFLDSVCNVLIARRTA